MTVKTKSKEMIQKNQRTIRNVIYSFIAILIGLYIGLLIMAVLGYNPGDFFVAAWDSSFGGIREFGEFLSVLTWMTFLGLAMTVSFRGGLFNIGVSAQMVGAGITGYLFAALVMSESRASVLGTIFIPIFTGMAIALFIALLKNRFNVNEVVSSILINWIIYWVYRFFRNPANVPILYPEGSSVPMDIQDINSLQAPWLTDLFDGASINIAIFILILVIPVLWFMYNRTSFGVKQKIISSNKNVAIYTGINVKGEVYKTMAISGALAGMAGAAFYCGTNQTLTYVSSDLAPEAFNGIAIALIGFNTIIGTVFASIILSLIENSKVQLSVYADSQVANLVAASIIWSAALTSFVIMYQPQNKIKVWLNKTGKSGGAQTPSAIPNSQESKDEFLKEDKNNLETSKNNNSDLQTSKVNNQQQKVQRGDK